MNTKLLLATLSGFLLILSCGKEKSSAELAEEHAMGILATMEKLPAALMKVKDEATLATAKEEIDAIRAELSQKADAIAELPKLEAETAASLEAKLDKAGEKLKDDMSKVMVHLQSLKNPALMMKVGEIMQSFGKDMESLSEKLEKVFKS